MATGLSPDTFSEGAYISVAEYKNAPTAVDFDNLVVGGNAAAQDAELANVILRASSYMDEYFNQNLLAGTTTETKRIRITQDGNLPIHPANTPVVALVSLSYGADPNSLIALPDPSKCWFEAQQIIVPLANLAFPSYSSQGPLGFGFSGSPRTPLYCKYTYVAGYVNSIFASSTSAGASSLTVTDASGIVPGETFRIFDGANSETVTVSSSYTFGSATVTLVSPMVNAHSAGATIGNLPNAIKQACILLTSAFIKVRGDNSLTMAVTTRANGNTPGANLFGNEVKLALDMVDKYRRIR
jgi:hypothetical protein